MLLTYEVTLVCLQDNLSLKRYSYFNFSVGFESFTKHFEEDTMAVPHFIIKVIKGTKKVHSNNTENEKVSW